MLVRKISPIKGFPLVTVRCKPSFNYNAVFPTVECGSNHIRFEGPNQIVRLSTDLAVSYVINEIPFMLSEDKHFIISTDESITKSLVDTVKDFSANTKAFWGEWCKYVNMPFEFQKYVLRCALTLRICVFDDSGAIVKSLTASIPYKEDSVGYDARYAWMKDSHIYTRVFGKLALISSLEEYLNFVLNIAHYTIKKDLPFYTNYPALYTTKVNLECEANCLAGYNGYGPVMMGKPMFYKPLDEINPIGSILMSLTYIFYDARLGKMTKLANFNYV